MNTQMETLTLVYGLAKGETRDYMEQLLSSRCKTLTDIEAVKQAAARDGFHSFRVAKSDGSAPNFLAAIGKQNLSKTGTIQPTLTN